MKKLLGIFLAILIVFTMGIMTTFAAPSPIIDHFGGSKMDKFNAVDATMDGGYVAVGTTSSEDGDMEGLNKGYYDAVIVKYNASGKQEWVNTFGGNKYETFFDVKQISDGGYIAVGCSSSLDGDMAGSSKAAREVATEYSNNDAIIVKFSSTGKMEWFKDFGGSILDRYNSVIETSDGNYIVVGETCSFDGDMDGLLKGNGDCIIAMYDRSGACMWMNNFGGLSGERFNSVVECEDGSFVAVGYTSSRDGYMEGTGNCLIKGLIVKFDSNQRIIWVKTEDLMVTGVNGLLCPPVYGFTDVQNTADNGFIISGAGVYFIEQSVGTTICNDARIFKYDSYGSKEWEDTYKYGDCTNFQSVTQGKDGSYLAVGYSYSTGPVASIAVSYDKNGKQQWAKNDAGEYNGDFDCIQATDTGYVVAGAVLTKDKYVEGLLYVGNFEESDGKLILSPETTSAGAPPAS